MSDGRCVKCGAPRWRGPNGTNAHLTMCEGCQRQYWRDAKTPRERQQRVRRDEQARRDLEQQS